MATYDDHVWRLFSEAPQTVYDVVLPKDLEWTDEFTWNPITQEVKNSLTGAVFVDEYKAVQGREISLSGKDDMGWVQRPIAEKLMAMRNTSGFKMKLQFVSATHDEDTDEWTFGDVHIEHTVMFRHSDTPLEFESVKRFDNFEATSWFKINSIRLIEIGSELDPVSPCT